MYPSSTSSRHRWIPHRPMNVVAGSRNIQMPKPCSCQSQASARETHACPRRFPALTPTRSTRARRDGARATRANPTQRAAYRVGGASGSSTEHRPPRLRQCSPRHSDEARARGAVDQRGTFGLVAPASETCVTWQPAGATTPRRHLTGGGPAATRRIALGSVDAATGARGMQRGRQPRYGAEGGAA